MIGSEHDWGPCLWEGQIIQAVGLLSLNPPPCSFCEQDIGNVYFLLFKDGRAGCPTCRKRLEGGRIPAVVDRGPPKKKLVKATQLSPTKKAHRFF